MAGSVFTIAAGQNFSKVLAQRLLQETHGAPERLTQYRILLPTRRACRILRDAFLDLSDGRAMLLPVMSPIGDVDAQDLSLMMFGQGREVLDIPPAISALKRRLILGKLIYSLPDFAQGADRALALAQSLCGFMDQVLVEEKDFDDLATLVPSDFAEHWQITLDFLKIVSKHWPEILREEGVVEVVERRRLLLRALAQHWSQYPLEGPVIAAGSTGSIPAVRAFLSAVLELPQGRVILPGLDRGMDDEAWDYIDEEHPQYVLKKTLEEMGVERNSVQLMGEEVPKRKDLSRLMMLPAQVSARWSEQRGGVEKIEAELEGLQFYACKTEHEEAGLIALLMREVLEEEGKVCALVTPDRMLARRVRSACRRWGIDVDDSAGQNLADTDLGRFSRLIIEVVGGGYDPVKLLALLKFPLCRVGRSKAECRRLVGALERDVLRQGKVIGGFEALCAAIEDEKVLVYFKDVYAALQRLLHVGEVFCDVLKAHLWVMEALARTEEEEGAQRLWRGDAGECGAVLFANLLQHGVLIGDTDLEAYGKMIDVLLRSETVRSAYGVHPRLLILGQLEARLTHADRVILGGLNEGSWTAQDYDPWMSWQMRKRFGLPGSEQSAGISAHDFMQAFCGADVIMTRSERVERSPSFPVRWLVRLDTVLQSCGRCLSDLSNPRYLYWLEHLDDGGVFNPAGRPEPRPPISARPKGVSVTKVEKWLQDPYSIYAYYVLGLSPMKLLIQDNDAAMKGDLLHKILERFVKTYPSRCGSVDNMICIAQDVVRGLVGDQDLLQHWWPRFYRVAEWFVAHEAVWRENATVLCSEVRGEADIDVDGEGFKLYGRADRIDRFKDGYGLIDYKSGGQFSLSALRKGALPQMPLEALILKHGGFLDLTSGAAVYLGYWILTGGQEPGKIVALEDDLEETVDICARGLEALVRLFRGADVPFYSVPDLSNVPRFNDYEHLARFKEWASLDVQAGEA